MWRNDINWLNFEFSAMLNVVAYNPIQHLRPLQRWKRFQNEFGMTGFHRRNDINLTFGFFIKYS